MPTSWVHRPIQTPAPVREADPRSSLKKDRYRWYARRDSNPRTWLRRPALYPTELRARFKNCTPDTAEPQTTTLPAASSLLEEFAHVAHTLRGSDVGQHSQSNEHRDQGVLVKDHASAEQHHPLGALK